MLPIIFLIVLKMLDVDVVAVVTSLSATMKLVTIPTCWHKNSSNTFKHDLIGCSCVPTVGEKYTQFVKF